MNETRQNKKFASKEAIPWLIQVILLVLIEQQQPLITQNPISPLASFLHMLKQTQQVMSNETRGAKELALHPYS